MPLVGPGEDFRITVDPDTLARIVARMSLESGGASRRKRELWAKRVLIAAHNGGYDLVRRVDLLAELERRLRDEEAG